MDRFPEIEICFKRNSIALFKKTLNDPRDAFPAILYKIGSIHLIPVGDHSQVICLYLYFPLFLCAWYRRGAVIMMIWRRGNNDENDSDVQSDHSDMCKWS